MTERELRAWVEAHGHPMLRYVLRKQDGRWWEPSPLPRELRHLEPMPGRCAWAALLLALEHRLAPCLGYVVVDEESVPLAHPWNLTADNRVADLALAGRDDLRGYFGAEIVTRQLVVLARWSGLGTRAGRWGVARPANP